MNTATWLIRREFWENRAIWLIPAALGGLLILGALFGGYQVVGAVDLTTVRTVVQAGALDGMIVIVAIFFVVMAIFSTWYLLDCLYSDRRDRSILFWKSMPISDTATVASKLGTALILIPLVYFAFADVTTLLMAFILSVRGARASIGSPLWHIDLWLQIQALWLYVIVTTALWYLPIAGWLLAVSAWAKRAVILWALLPPLGLALAERVFLGTHVIAAQIGARLGFGSYAAHAFQYTPGPGNWMTTEIGHDTINTPVSLYHFMNAGGFLSSAATWIGAAVGVALIIGAIQMRMRRTEI
jgi:ABC-2 type transport system permease protein